MYKTTNLTVKKANNFS